MSWHWGSIRITSPLWGESTDHSFSPDKGTFMQDFDHDFAVSLTKTLLNKRPSCRWFETFWSSCDVTEMQWNVAISTCAMPWFEWRTFRHIDIVYCHKKCLSRTEWHINIYIYIYTVFHVAISHRTPSVMLLHDRVLEWKLCQWRREYHSRLISQYLDYWWSCTDMTSYWWPTPQLYIYRERVQCRYNAVNFPPNPHNRHPIARPWRQGMGCLFWF